MRKPKQKKETAPKKKTGAPSFPWTEEIEDEILGRIMAGESVAKICATDRDDFLPSEKTFYKHLTDDAAFAQRYARAREVQADRIFEEILEIADDATNDWMERQGDDAPAGYVLNGEHVQRSRLRIEARRWMAGKLRPKVYGDKLELDGKLDVNMTNADRILRARQRLDGGGND